MKSVRTKVTGIRPALDALKIAIGEILERNVNPLVEQILEKRLETNTNADGSPRPSSQFVSQSAIRKSKTATIDATAGPGEKAPATIREYKRHGYDTEHYLVRTGKSTELKHKVTGTRLTIEPATAKGRKILSYHIPMSQWRGPITWFELNDKEMEAINRRVTNGLKRHGY